MRTIYTGTELGDAEIRRLLDSAWKRAETGWFHLSGLVEALRMTQPEIQAGVAANDFEAVARFWRSHADDAFTKKVQAKTKVLEPDYEGDRFRAVRVQVVPDQFVSDRVGFRQAHPDVFGYLRNVEVLAQVLQIPISGEESYFITSSQLHAVCADLEIPVPELEIGLWDNLMLTETAYNSQSAYLAGAPAIRCRNIYLGDNDADLVKIDRMSRLACGITSLIEHGRAINLANLSLGQRLDRGDIPRCC
jgi:hypothetical protein